MWVSGLIDGRCPICDIPEMESANMPTGHEFYGRLEEALSDACLPTTQVQIAELLGVSQGTVSKWKNNRSYPAKEAAARAAELCGVSLPWLYFGIGHKKAGADMDEMVWALMSAFESLPDDQKRELVEFAKFKAATHRRPEPQETPDQH